jgi:hypothetical protein
VVTVVVGDRLQVLAPTDGAPLQSIPLPSIPLPSGSASAAPGELAAGGSVVVWARGTVLVLDHSTGAVRWQGPALGLPGVPDGGPTSSAQSAVVVPEDGAFVVRDVGTGTESGRWSVSGVPSGGSVTVVGPGVVDRLADRVVGYR